MSPMLRHRPPVAGCERRPTWIRNLAGFIGLAALMIALVAWLRADMNGRMDRLETAHAERFGRIETAQAEQIAMLSKQSAMLSGIGECLTRIEATLSDTARRCPNTANAWRASRAPWPAPSGVPSPNS